MNDGVLSIVLQWSLICVVWMGSLDRQLHRLHLSRRSALFILTVTLICAFTSWRLYFFPVDVNVGGAIIPLLLSCWSWLHLPKQGKTFLILAAFLFACALYFARLFAFRDPVLLVWDEKLLLPVLLITVLVFLTRNWQVQWFIILVALPLADAFYTLNFLDKGAESQIGGAKTQDLLWCTICLWTALMSLYSTLQKSVVRSYRRFVRTFKLRTKTHSHR
ncbi:YphA family membrane protein [Brevibacillus massiliensis]|jgi:hypothetical protein|uniref:YphA family membrane protein n=1 Tax=Brevibacillus massiliensis TaxID=1118054 RepID=UPI0002E98DF0|nr:hypothetical protein [Brevibacillus massiliensis]